MHWITVTDENGNDFHALTADPEGAAHASCWVFTDKESGFQDDVGRVNYKKDLKRLPDGKYGA